MTKLIITIDAEGDNVWNRPDRVSVRNADFLARFQTCCEKYNFKPTYLANYEMAIARSFGSFGRDGLRRGVCEIGSHIHAWDSPPFLNEVLEGSGKGSYLLEFERRHIALKIDYITKLLEDTFAVPITSHRAGRWAIDGRYATALAENGYLVDCSVTPHVNWSSTIGYKTGGPDYSTAPQSPYIMRASDVSCPSVDEDSTGLLQVPMTVRRLRNGVTRRVGSLLPKTSVSARVFDRIWPDVSWLRPNGRNLATVKMLLRKLKAERPSHIEFMLHSSELMPGGSPIFPTRESVESLYGDIEQIFSDVAGWCSGTTLSEFALSWRAGSSVDSDVSTTSMWV